VFPARELLATQGVWCLREAYGRLNGCCTEMAAAVGRRLEAEHEGARTEPERGYRWPASLMSWPVVVKLAGLAIPS